MIAQRRGDNPPLKEFQWQACEVGFIGHLTGMSLLLPSFILNSFQIAYFC